MDDAETHDVARAENDPASSVSDPGDSRSAPDKTADERHSCRARRAVEQAIIDSLPVYRRMSARRLRSVSDAEDIVQVFALKALERAGQLRDSMAVRGWLRRIFETTLVDHCRARVRAREVQFEMRLHDKAEYVDAPDQGARELGPLVAELLPRLKREYADIILKLDLQDSSRAETARTLGITANNLTVRLHRARCALRKQIGLADASVMEFA